MIFQDRDINNSDRTLSVFLLKLSGPAQIWATSLWMKFNSGLDQSTFMVSSYCRSSIINRRFTQYSKFHFSASFASQHFMKGKSKNCWWVTLHQCVEYCSFSCSMIRLHHDTGDYTMVTIQTERQLLEGEWQEHCVCCLFSCLCVSVSIQQQFLYLTAGSYCIILSV